MHDRKTIRRRRAVLGLFVVLSLGLLTASFGDGLRSVERGALEVFGPIQEGASKALKPLRDGAGWIGESLEAKGQVEDLRAERDRLRVELAEARDARLENEQLRGLLQMDRRLGLADQAPVTASVFSDPAGVWSSTVTIDKGRSDGVREGQPVVASGGLVGRVQMAGRGSSVVQLINDDGAGVAARTDAGIAGIVEAELGSPSDLRLRYVSRVENVEEGQTVVTAGTRSERFPSQFPAGLPIGRIAEVDDDDRVHVRPFADVRRLALVQVLTDPGGSVDTDGATQ